MKENRTRKNAFEKRCYEKYGERNYFIAPKIGALTNQKYTKNGLKNKRSAKKCKNVNIAYKMHTRINKIPLSDF